MFSLTRRTIVSIVSLTAIVLSTPVAPPIAAQAQSHITTPKEQFGVNFGDDYFLANYKQLAAYWQKLDARVRSHGRCRRSARPPKAARS